MVRMRNVLAAAAIVLAAAGTGRADFVLSGTQHKNVTSGHNIGLLYQQSTADVETGGEISNAFVYDEASLRVLAGVVKRGDAYGSSSVDVSGGTISDHLSTFDSSSVDISGGSVHYLYAEDTSSLVISGGNIYSLHASNTSSVDISGGSIDHNLYATDTSSVVISGGSLEDVHAEFESTVDISGGSVFALYAKDDTTVTLHGYDFSPVAGDLSLEGELVLGTGVLSGNWSGGTPWTMTIPFHDPYATIRMNVIPEPSALLLLATGALGLLAGGWRRRRRSA